MIEDWAKRLAASSRQDGACRIWEGTVNQDGYGVFNYNDESGRRRSMGAHKAAFLAAGGTLASGEVVRHVVCHRTLCIAPAHLAPGSQKQNLDDRKESGTYFNRGFNISDDERLDRLEALEAGMTPKQYAETYGVSLNAAYQWFRRNRISRSA